MDFLEKDLEEIVFNTPNARLVERGLDLINGKKLRQVTIGNYGRADLISITREHRANLISIKVYELKKGIIDSDTFFQAVNYLRGIMSYISKRKIFDDYHVDYSIILIGRAFANDKTCYLPSVFENVFIYTYDYDYDGIKFNEQKNWSLKVEGFSDLLPF